MDDQIISVKCGQNIDWTGKWSINGIAQNIDDFDVLCQIRDTVGVLLIDMDVEASDQNIHPGYYSLSATAIQTAVVKPGVYDCDIMYKSQMSGQVEYTESFLVEFIGSVSRVLVP